MDSGDANTLVKIAVFCLTFSIVSTAICSVFAAGSGDYDYDVIKGYQQELSEFTGGNLVNDTPWVLTAVYTPWIPQIQSQGQDIADHIDPDGWLYGDSITSYSEIGKAADISLSSSNKSNQKLSIGTPYDYSYRSGEEWWNGGNDYGIVLLAPSIAQFLTGGKSGDGYIYTSGTANNWNYTGYRYVFDPTLPFSNGASSKDGSLSIVWYDFDGESGLSGGLVIYGSKDKSNQTVVLADYSASDIIAGYQTSNGYASTYDFVFDGTHLNLSIKFNPDVLTQYSSLRAAWDAGAWTMSISSASAGNYFDVENSNAFTTTAGGMLETFIEIYTFDYPEFSGENEWVNVILWLIVGLPMTLGMLLITLRTVGGIFKIF